MGGYGSGGGGYYSKYAVEDSLSFSIYNVIGKKKWLYPHSSTLHWSINGEPTSSIGYRVEIINEELYLDLDYNHNAEPVKERIRILKTPQPYGNFRYWMFCPLLRNGYTCNRRCHKVYSSPGQKYFGCRKCMNLTYQSCKDSHKYDSFYARIATECSLPPWFVKRAMKRSK
jgi:hypothetical protein